MARFISRCPYVARIFAALGDGYWPVNSPAKARDVWAKVGMFPDAASLHQSLNASPISDRNREHALDADLRVDTELRERLRSRARCRDREA